MGSADRATSLASFTTVAPPTGGSTREQATLECAHGTLTFGSSMIGGMVRLVPSADALAPGDRAAPLMVRALPIANREWSLDFPPSTAAPDVR